MSGGHEAATSREPRLLRHLREDGAFAVDSPFGCGRIALYRKVRGASLGAGYVPAAEADALVAAGQACWSRSGVPRRLTLAGGESRQPADAGRALAVASVVVAGEERRVLIDERESPLLWLHRRRGKDGKPQISAEEFAAGERFRADLTLSQMLPRVTANWDIGLSAGTGRDPGSASDSALAARQRVDGACRSLGPDMSGLAIDICGFLKGLDTVERERGWPARSAKIVLRLALAALVQHYGIGPVAARGKRRVEAWRAPDASPAFPARA